MESKIIKGFKGFDKDMKCQGFQYEPGKEFKHEGEVGLCQSGFHFCESPLDVLDFYPLLDDKCEPNVFAEIEASGEIKKDEKKSVTGTIKIGAKLTFPEFVNKAISFIMDACKIKDSAKLASSGSSAQLASSGDSAQLASSGYSAKLASSGYSAKLASSGDSAQLASSGDSAQLEVKGKNSVAANIGINGTIKSTLGTWITLAEYDEDDICICVKSARVDGKKIKADTWYCLKDEKFTEVK